MLVKEIMNTDVKTMSPNSSVQKAAKKMSKHHVGCLIVVKDSRLIGIVTERDIMRDVVAKALDAKKTKVKNVMTKEVIMVDPERDVEDAAEIMTEKKIKKLPVILHDKVIGIVTAMDIVTAHPKTIEQIGKLLLLPKKKVVAG